MSALWRLCRRFHLRLVRCGPDELSYERTNIARISSPSFCVVKVEAVTMNNNHAAFQSRTQNGHPYPARQRATLPPMQAGGRGESPLSSVRCWIHTFHLPRLHLFSFKDVTVLNDFSFFIVRYSPQQVWQFTAIWSWRWRAGRGRRWSTPATAPTARDQMRRANTERMEKTAEGTGKSHKKYRIPLVFTASQPSLA